MLEPTDEIKTHINRAFERIGTDFGATYMGVSVDKFDKPELIKLCNILTAELKDWQGKYFNALAKTF